MVTLRPAGEFFQLDGKTDRSAALEDDRISEFNPVDEGFKIDHVCNRTDRAKKVGSLYTG